MDVVAKRAGEREPRFPARARAAVDVGDGWRPHASPGSREVYDQRLSGQRDEAKKLRYRLRVKAAHDREIESYRIRRRGWDRKYGDYGEVYDDEVGKADRSRRRRSLRRERQRVELGPLKVDRRLLSFARPTAGDSAAKIVGAMGVPRLAIAGGAGAVAAGVADSDARGERAKKRAKSASRAMLGLPEEVGEPMSKSLVEISKSMPESWDDVSKAGFFSSFSAPVKTGFKNFRANPKLKDGDYGGAFDDALSAGKKEWSNQGGWQAASTTDKAALGVGAGAAALGAGKWAARRFGEPLKARAKKYALYGAGGLAGATALGTAAGNMATNQ